MLIDSGSRSQGKSGREGYLQSRQHFVGSRVLGGEAQLPSELAWTGNVKSSILWEFSDHPSGEMQLGTSASAAAPVWMAWIVK